MSTQDLLLRRSPLPLFLYICSPLSSLTFIFTVPIIEYQTPCPDSSTLSSYSKYPMVHLRSRTLPLLPNVYHPLNDSNRTLQNPLHGITNSRVLYFKHVERRRRVLDKLVNCKVNKGVITILLLLSWLNSNHTTNWFDYKNFENLVTDGLFSVY